MKADTDKRSRDREGNRRRVAESRKRHNDGRGCCDFEYDADMLDAAVKAGLLSNFETDPKKIAVALAKLLRQKIA